MDARSRTELAHGIGTADDIAARVCRISLPDVSESLGIAQHVDGLLQLRQVLRTQDDCRRLAVAGDHDAFMLVLHPINDLGQVVTDIPQGLGRYDRNCGASGAPVQP